MTGSAGTGSASSTEEEDGDALGWVLLDPGRVPPRWRGRGRPVVLVPLVGEEVTAVLAGSPAVPALDDIDEQLVRLAARGATIAQMARALGLSTRSVSYRLAGLRERFGAATTAELVAELARRGFPLATSSNGSSEATSPAPANTSDQGLPR